MDDKCSITFNSLFVTTYIGAHLVSYVKGTLLENMDLGDSHFSPISAQYKAVWILPLISLRHSYVVLER